MICSGCSNYIHKRDAKSDRGDEGECYTKNRGSFSAYAENCVCEKTNHHTGNHQVKREKGFKERSTLSHIRNGRDKDPYKQEEKQDSREEDDAREKIHNNVLHF
jgi:hypothetical protein